MDSREKVLYHQIHPAKLLTDIGASVASLFFFWQHELVVGLLVGWIPSIIGSWMIIRFGNLEKLKESPLGQYVRRYMTHEIEAVRLLGQIVVWFGAWYRIVLLVVLGYLVVVLAWAKGKLFPSEAREIPSAPYGSSHISRTVQSFRVRHVFPIDRP